MEGRAFVGLSFLLIASCLPACATTTVQTRSALVPRPTPPASIGSPLPEAGVRLFGHASSIGLTQQTQQPEDLEDPPTRGFGTMMLPRYQFGGGLYAGLSDYVELGGHFSLAGYSSAERNLEGGREFPEDTRDRIVFVGGPGLRANLPIPEVPLTPSLHFEVNIASIPEATYLTRDGEPDVALSDRYFLYPNLQLSVTYSPFHEHVHIMPFFGLQRGVTNPTFAEEQSSGSNSLVGYGHGVAGVAFEGRFKYATLATTIFVPIGGPPGIEFGPSMSVTAGFRYR